jgi:hypothetical protein
MDIFTYCILMLGNLFLPLKKISKFFKNKFKSPQLYNCSFRREKKKKKKKKKVQIKKIL